MDNYLLQNQLTPTKSLPAPDVHFVIPNWRAFEETLLAANLADKQRECIDIVTSYLNGTRCGQMMMFLSGEGGTGKSHVINLIMEYGKLYFSKTYGLYGPVVALGPTGVAANYVGGFTWQSVCKLSKSSKKTNATLESKIVMGRNIDGVKLIIIDEISMVSCESLHMMSKRFTDATISTITDPEERKRLETAFFGDIHVLFVGDFYPISIGSWRLKSCTSILLRI